MSQCLSCQYISYAQYMSPKRNAKLPITMLTWSSVLHRDAAMVSVSAFNAVGRGFAPWQCILAM